MIAAPEHIAVSKSRGLAIDWPDGQRSDFSVEFLRDNCPCASCMGTHGEVPYKERKKAQDLFPMYKPALRIDAVEPVGTYAVKIGFNDGHATGIYSWTLLRELHEEETTSEDNQWQP